MSSSDRTSRLEIFDVTPRDGLQNEDEILDVQTRVSLIERAVEAGVRDIEIGSFVHPKWVPQMADTDEVAKRLERSKGVRYWALVPNMTGLKRALDCRIRHIATFISASETHNQQNKNRSVDESLREIEQIVGEAKSQDCRVKAYISTAFGCPYEGRVEFDRVVELMEAIDAMGVDLLALGDTIGAADPIQIREAVDRSLELFDANKLALHLHDTQGLALTNAFVARERGLYRFDGSIGGIGGCPYAPGAAGNVGTEDLLHLFDKMGDEPDVDLDRILEVSSWLDNRHDFALSSRYYQYASRRDESCA